MPQVYAPHDILLAEHAFLELSVGLIEFQFPPTIPSDGRKGTWNEKDVPGREPTAAFQTSGPREISLAWTYIVDAVNDGWTTERIAENVHRIRGYFAQVRDNEDNRNLLVKFRYGLFGGKEPTTARIKSIDVKHGDTMVIPDRDNSLAFPLRTDITIDLRLWNKTEAEDVKGIIQITPEWF